jgi:hypothetical protein
MSLWADKYRPQSLDKLSYHNELSEHLKKMVRASTMEMVLHRTIINRIVSPRQIQAISRTCCFMDLLEQERKQELLLC